eukprot:CAMPEP_0170519402 /NCGR_PEP_ID=MMETSP0209-20121228/4832_1 /TAXON_ID=665100 ORGANISM="Litonotus pictus, Strain P1" /NCGR_SAMPLE_ID=MMETSP0209 /ASSEMBLY_ACC=CAM_ASM_000301 /LENGTH=286 /DNA_ID=CAMNT_0010805277 /DNA_START=3806 /DNA_END=4666 /DNA_ORIENTATION=+
MNDLHGEERIQEPGGGDNNERELQAPNEGQAIQDIKDEKKEEVCNKVPNRYDHVDPIDIERNRNYNNNNTNYNSNDQLNEKNGPNLVQNASVNKDDSDPNKKNNSKLIKNLERGFSNQFNQADNKEATIEDDSNKFSNSNQIEEKLKQTEDNKPSINSSRSCSRSNKKIVLHEENPVQKEKEDNSLKEENLHDEGKQGEIRIEANQNQPEIISRKYICSICSSKKHMKEVLSGNFSRKQGHKEIDIIKGLEVGRQCMTCYDPHEESVVEQLKDRKDTEARVHNQSY